LAGEPSHAYKAVILLATAPKQTLALLQDKVKPTAGVDAKEINQLIADLESNQFEVREKANTALEKLGELAQPWVPRTRRFGAASAVGIFFDERARHF
jgi:hypothetical protein